MSNRFEDDFPTTPSMRAADGEYRATMPDWSSNPDELMGQLMTTCVKTENRVKLIHGRMSTFEVDQGTLLREVRQLNRRIDDLFDVVRIGGKKTVLTTGAIVGIAEVIGQIWKALGH